MGTSSTPRMNKESSAAVATDSGGEDVLHVTSEELSRLSTESFLLPGAVASATGTTSLPARVQFRRYFGADKLHEGYAKARRAWNSYRTGSTSVKRNREPDEVAFSVTATGEGKRKLKLMDNNLSEVEAVALELRVAAVERRHLLFIRALNVSFRARYLDGWYGFSPSAQASAARDCALTIEAHRRAHEQWGPLAIQAIKEEFLKRTDQSLVTVVFRAALDFTESTITRIAVAMSEVNTYVGLVRSLMVGAPLSAVLMIGQLNTWGGRVLGLASKQQDLNTSYEGLVQRLAAYGYNQYSDAVTRAVGSRRWTSDIARSMWETRMLMQQIDLVQRRDEFEELVREMRLRVEDLYSEGVQLKAQLSLIIRQVSQGEEAAHMEEITAGLFSEPHAFPSSGEAEGDATPESVGAGDSTRRRVSGFLQSENAEAAHSTAAAQAAREAYRLLFLESVKEENSLMSKAWSQAPVAHPIPTVGESAPLPPLPEVSIPGATPMPYDDGESRGSERDFEDDAEEDDDEDEDDTSIGWNGPTGLSNHSTPSSSSGTTTSSNSTPYYSQSSSLASSSSDDDDKGGIFSQRSLSPPIPDVLSGGGIDGEGEEQEQDQETTTATPPTPPRRPAPLLDVNGFPDGKFVEQATPASATSGIGIVPQGDFGVDLLALDAFPALGDPPSPIEPPSASPWSRFLGPKVDDIGSVGSGVERESLLPGQSVRGLSSTQPHAPLSSSLLDAAQTATTAPAPLSTPSGMGLGHHSSVQDTDSEVELMSMSPLAGAASNPRFVGSGVLSASDDLSSHNESPLRSGVHRVTAERGRAYSEVRGRLQALRAVESRIESLAEQIGSLKKTITTSFQPAIDEASQRIMVLAHQYEESLLITPTGLYDPRVDLKQEMR